MPDQVLFTSGVGAEFRQACTAGWAAIPERARRVLGSHGVSVKCIRSVWEDMPGFAGTPIRSGDRTGVNLPAFYRRREIVVPEFHVSQATGRVETARDPAACLCHEAGHAFDDALGPSLGSGGVAFRRAYQADVDGMASAQWMELLYFTEPRAGRRETFAEAFAIAVGQPTPEFGARVSAAFPQAIAIVRDIIKGLDEAAQ